MTFFSKLRKKNGSNTIPAATVELIKKFYYHDEISRETPGKKDYISVREGGVRVQKQVRMMLLNINEAYQMFKKMNENVKVGVSKFASVRPRECRPPLEVLGTHSVCVCLYHQNVKLTIDALRKNMQLPDHLLQGDEGKQYRNFCAMLMCEDAKDDCYLRNCRHCLKSGKLHALLDGLFENSPIERLTYKPWISTGILYFVT